MKKGYTLPILFLLFHASLSWALFEKIEGLDKTRITQITFSKETDSTLLVTSENTLYLSNDGGITFNKIVSLKDEKITHAFFQDESTLYISSTRNAYRYKKKLERIFSIPDNESIHYINQYNQTLLLATSQGLYQTKESILNWHRIPELADNNLYYIEQINPHLFVIGNRGLYHVSPEGKLNRTYITRSVDEENFAQEKAPFQLHTVHTDLFNTNHYWLTSSKGLLHSTDKGASWKKLSLPRIEHASIKHLGQTSGATNKLYLCSNIGLFIVDTKTGNSKNLFAGLPTSKINWIDFDETGTLYVATDKGLFKKTQEDNKHNHPVSLRDLIANEPSIHQIQEAALRFNSAHPEKMVSWKKRIKYRALFPELTIDYDRTIGSSFTQSGHYFAEGPHDWGINLKWDIGDILWNPYESTEDTRSRLNTQLRFDIIDDINRLYYERIRLKHQILSLQEPDEIFIQELRLLELTAALDGYTGGYFRKQTNQAPQKLPSSSH
jgi:hypothetical protein